MWPIPSLVVSMGMGVCQGAHPDALLGQVVDEVEDFPQVAAEPVEGVHGDHVAASGVAEQGSQAGPIDGGAGLLVAVGPTVGDAGGGQRVQLALQGLPGCRHAGVPQGLAGGGVGILHARGIVPEVVFVPLFRNVPLRDDFRNAATWANAGRRVPGAPGPDRRLWNAVPAGVDGRYPMSGVLIGVLPRPDRPPH